jgi:aryl-alcohol dehydrogenase-like predicted oxidoreductase
MAYRPCGRSGLVLPPISLGLWQNFEDTLAKVRGLNAIAGDRGQSLAQMALAWTLRDRRLTSALSAGQLAATRQPDPARDRRRVQ